MFITLFTRARHWSLSWERWIHTLPTCFFRTHFNIILPPMSMSSEWSLDFRFSDQNLVRISHRTYACYMSRLSHPLEVMTLIFGEACKLWSSSLCSLLQPAAASSLFGPNIPLSTLFSHTLSLLSSVVWEIKFHTHTKQLIPWGRVLLDKLIVTQIPNSPPFMEPETSLLCSQEPPRREADHSSPSSAKVKNAWNYNSTPAVRLQSVVLSLKNTGTTLPLLYFTLQEPVTGPYPEPE
jgi:hypothetical protein